MLNLATEASLTNFTTSASPSLGPYFLILYFLSRIPNNALFARVGSNFSLVTNVLGFLLGLLLTFYRGIDYALANGETPPKAHELPLLVKQVMIPIALCRVGAFFHSLIMMFIYVLGFYFFPFPCRYVN